MTILNGTPQLATSAPPDSTRGGLRIVETDWRTDPRWGSFVAAHPEGLVYHHPAWLQVLEREYKQECLSLACENEAGELQGILPLFYTRGLPFGLSQLGGQATGRRLVSLPRTPIAGPLALSVEATTSLVSAAVERAHKEPGVQLQLKTLTPELDGLVGGVVCTPWRLTFVLRLPENPEQYRIPDPRNRSRIKCAINKAIKSGVQVRVAETVGDLRSWYDLYLDTMRRNVVPPRAFRFFFSIVDLLQPKGLAKLLLAERYEAGRRRLLAGSIFLMLGNRVFFAFNGSSEEGLSLQPNYIIHWQAIQDACRAGFRFYDFGEVPEGIDQLADFKRKWGAEPTRLYRYYYPASNDLESQGVESPSHLRLIAEGVWRRLPLRATALIGDQLYSYL